jgi:hypothetical protein
MSPFVYFPIEEIYKRLNAAEGRLHGSRDAWGGSDTVGGSPRLSHSRLKPGEVERIINAAVALH